MRSLLSSTRLRAWIPALAVAVLALAGVVALSWQDSTGPATEARVSWPGGSLDPAPSSEAAEFQPDSELSTAPATLTSLLANPGFELGEGSGMIEGWDLGAGTYQTAEGGGYRGAKYASVQNTGEPYTSAIFSSRFPVAAGEDILVSLQAKAVSGEPVLEIYVHWFDAGGTELAATHLHTLETDGEAVWQEAAGAFTAPAGTSAAQVVIYEAAGGGATLGVDEVVVRAH